MERKKIMVLGASSDMAMAISTEYAKNGYDVLLAARKSTRLLPLASDLKIRFNVETEVVEFDAQEYAAHLSLAQDSAKDCNVVVCAFGYLGDQSQAESSWEESHRIIQANYLGCVSILNAIAEVWKGRKSGGTIIGISSVAGDRGRSSNFIYGSAKAALSTYLAGLRNSLYHHGIHVMTVKPGFVKSKMTNHLDLPYKLTSSPDQVAMTVYMAHSKSKNTVYISWIWKWIMLVIGSVPEPIFKKMKM